MLPAQKHTVDFLVQSMLDCATSFARRVCASIPFQRVTPSNTISTPRAANAQPYVENTAKNIRPLRGTSDAAAVDAHCHGRCVRLTFGNAAKLNNIHIDLQTCTLFTVFAHSQTNSHTHTLIHTDRSQQMPAALAVAAPEPETTTIGETNSGKIKNIPIDNWRINKSSSSSFVGVVAIRPTPAGIAHKHTRIKSHGTDGRDSPPHRIRKWVKAKAVHLDYRHTRR